MDYGAMKKDKQNEVNHYIKNYKAFMVNITKETIRKLCLSVHLFCVCRIYVLFILHIKEQVV